jgi:acyl homoserine lactone synthase
MMTLIQGSRARLHPELMDQMFRLRARVFADRLGWDVVVEDGWERDRFDDLDPLYALSLNAAGHVQGTFRLLQTTGPTMLDEVFAACLPEGLKIRSPIVWESTRFCVDTSSAAALDRTGLNTVTGELLSSLIEIGNYAGLSHIVTVIDQRMERILLRAGCPIDRLGAPVDIGGTMTLAILMDCSEASIERIQRKNNLHGACIDREAVEMLQAA